MRKKSLGDLTVEELWKIAKNYKSTQGLVDAYVSAHNKFWVIEDEIYDYEEGTEKYNQTETMINEWEEILDCFQDLVVAQAQAEGLLAPREENSGLVKQLEAFMTKYGYRDGRGWWLKIENNV